MPGATSRSATVAWCCCVPSTLLHGGLPETRRVKFAGNRFDRSELAGAFGDLGTLVPFVVGYITIARHDSENPLADIRQSLQFLRNL